MVKISIFCTFSRTPPRVFIRSSSKLGRMCRINLQKNVLSRNFEFLAQLIFSWDQTLKKIKSSKMRYVFAIQISPAFCLLRIKAQSFYIFNQNSKILIFGRLSAKISNFTNLLPSCINLITTIMSKYIGI